LTGGLKPNAGLSHRSRRRGRSQTEPDRGAVPGGRRLRICLDEPGWEALEAFRRRIAFTILGIVLLVGIVAVFWAMGR